MYWSRQFRRRVEARRSARLGSVPDLNVPEIFVNDPDDLAGQPSAEPHDFTEPAPPVPPVTRGPSSSIHRDKTPSVITTNLWNQARKDDRSPTNSDYSFSASPSLTPQRLSEMDTAYHGAGRSLSPEPPSPSTHGRQTSSINTQDVMESLDNSAWGESIRRSFTTRRPPSPRTPP